MYKVKKVGGESEHADVVPYPLLLVLCDAFSDPSDVSYFLVIKSAYSARQKRGNADLFPQLHPGIYHCMSELPCED